MDDAANSLNALVRPGLTLEESLKAMWRDGHPDGPEPPDDLLGSFLGAFNTITRDPVRVEEVSDEE